MSKQTFKTRKEAKVEEAKMQGWETKVTQLYQPDDPNANGNGNVFVIQCDGDKYLQENGYVN